MFVLYLLLVASISCSEILAEQSLAVTIYNDDFAMVKDVRKIKFDQGESVLYFTDVSSNIETATVTFKALQNPETIRVYEQNFEKNLVSQSGILDKYINQKIEIVAQFANQVKRISGTLLSHGSNFILQTENGGVVIAQKISAIELPALPDGFFTKPTLNWKVWSKTAQQTSCQVAYRTTGFSWKADYTLVLDKTDSKADIGGWVTIDNNSGKKYVDAKLKLIAGDVNTVSSVQPVENYYYAEQGLQMAVADAAPPQFSEKSFADYHLYTLSQPVTLNESSQKQVQFIPKVYGVQMRSFNELSFSFGGYSQDNLKASSKVQFNNSAENGLGIPFPKGTFRTFKEDPDDGSLQFIGQDSIDHTPKNENITLLLGNSFDLTAKVYAESRRNYDKGGYEAAMNLTVNNRKDKQVQLQVLMNTYYGDNLNINQDSGNIVKFEKVTANQYRINVFLKPDQTTTFKWVENYRP